MNARVAVWVVRYPYLEHHSSMTCEHWVIGYPRIECPALARQCRPTAVACKLLYPTSMSKTRKRSRHGVTDRSTTTDVVTQLECAIKNPHAALIGAVIGGLVPWFGRTLAHEGVPTAWSASHHGLAITMVAVVLGCACFSAISVYKFGRAAFGDARKAIGFTLALEGVMLVSSGATSNAALAVLILINAVANGSVIALARDATCRRREADARRAATRARSRTRRASAQPTQPRSANVHGLVKVPSWNPTDDAIDAEIVSEEMFS